MCRCLCCACLPAVCAVCACTLCVPARCLCLHMALCVPARCALVCAAWHLLCLLPAGMQTCAVPEHGPAVATRPWLAPALARAPPLPAPHRCLQAEAMRARELRGPLHSMSRVFGGQPAADPRAQQQAASPPPQGAYAAGMPPPPTGPAAYSPGQGGPHSGAAPAAAAAPGAPAAAAPPQQAGVGGAGLLGSIGAAAAGIGREIAGLGQELGSTLGLTDRLAQQVCAARRACSACARVLQSMPEGALPCCNACRSARSTPLRRRRHAPTRPPSAPAPLSCRGRPATQRPSTATRDRPQRRRPPTTTQLATLLQVGGWGQEGSPSTQHLQTFDSPFQAAPVEAATSKKARPGRARCQRVCVGAGKSAGRPPRPPTPVPPPPPTTTPTPPTHTPCCRHARVRRPCAARAARAAGPAPQL